MPPRRSKTAAEFVRELQRDPQYVARQAVLRAEAEQRAAAIAQDEAPLVRELAESGIDVRSVWDFGTLVTPPAAVPIVLRHLTLTHHPRVREGLIRALAYSHLRAQALEPLKEFFRSESDPDVRWLLANSLAAMAKYREVSDLVGIAEFRGLFRLTPQSRIP